MPQFPRKVPRRSASNASTWQDTFSPTGGLSIDSAAVTFRYDALAANVEGGEGNLKLYENSGQGWKLLAGWPTDVENHLISGTGSITAPTEFAVVNSILVIWSGLSTTGNNWSDAANWNTVPTGEETLHFTGLTRTAPNNDFPAGTSFSGLRFDAGAASFTIGGNPITMTGDIINYSSNNQTINLAMALTSTAMNLNTGGTTLTLGGNLSNSGTIVAGLNVLGGGMLVLSGSNSFTGTTTITAGTLSVATIGNGGVVGNLGAATNAAGNLVFNGGSLLYTGASANTTGSFTIAAGQTATFVIANPATNLTISGSANAGYGALTKDGTGHVDTHSFQLLYGRHDGAGRRAQANNNALGVNDLTMSGGTLDLAGFAPTVVSLSGTGVIGNSQTGPAAASQLTVTAGGLFAGTIQDGVGGGNSPVALRLTGGTLTLNASSTYSGGTTINAGALVLGPARPSAAAAR